MRITAITQCKNEEKILPFFLDYYTSFCDEIIIFDGNSADNSHNIIKSFLKNNRKCNIELRITDSVGVLDNIDEETIIKELNCNYNLSNGWNRNNGYKHLYTSHINEWILVVDCDEFFYHKDGVRNKLEQLQQEGISLPDTMGYNMVSKTFPKYKKGKFIFDEIKLGFYYKDQCKPTAFNSKMITNINLQPGCHWAKPEGNVVKGKEQDNDKLKILHFRFLGVEYVNKLAEFKFNDLSYINKKSGWGIHYEEHKNIKEDYFDMLLRDCKSVIE
jgi:hypothetical protein